MAAKKIELNESREVTLTHEQVEEALVDYLAKAGRVLTEHAAFSFHGVPMGDDIVKKVEIVDIMATVDVEPKPRKTRAAKG